MGIKLNIPNISLYTSHIQRLKMLLHPYESAIGVSSNNPILPLHRLHTPLPWRVDGSLWPYVSDSDHHRVVCYRCIAVRGAYPSPYIVVRVRMMLMEGWYMGSGDMGGYESTSYTSDIVCCYFCNDTISGLVIINIVICFTFCLYITLMADWFYYWLCFIIGSCLLI